MSPRTLLRWLVLALGLAAALAAGAGSALAESSSSGARALQAGLLDLADGFSCAILDDGTPTCWGNDNNGTIGDDVAIAGKARPTAVAVPGGRTARAIGVGDQDGCALLDDGRVVCWGVDGNGQLGDDEADVTMRTPVPVALPAGRTATALSVGGFHACAILDDGSARCWGFNGVGQVGNGSGPGNLRVPATVSLPAGRTATAIAAGGAHTCAILDDASLWCWGSDLAGQLGDDAPKANRTVPTPVALPPGRTAVAVSAGVQHTCAILDDGSAWCWGDDTAGGLGDDDPTAEQTLPVRVALPAGRTAVAIAAGLLHTCAVLGDGSLACWGSDVVGQLGDDAPTVDRHTPTPVPLPAGRTAVAIAVAYVDTCAILDDGSLRCWGDDADDALGNGLGALSQTEAALAPPALPAGGTVGRVADVSVALEGAPASIVAGGTGTVGVRIANAGPDAATGLRVSLQSTLLSLSATLVGQGTLAAATWTVGTLAPGATATLALGLGGLAAGAGSIAAELLAAGERDPDSTPASGVGEDDRASVAIAVTGAPTPPPAPPAPPPAPTKLAPEKLTLVLSTAKDATAPHTATASGRLVATSVAPRTACVGRVTVTAKAGKKTLLTRTATLKLRDGACEYAAKLSLTATQRGAARSVKVTAAFAGNDALLAATSKARTLKLA